MRCDGVRDLLPELHHGELSSAVRHRVDAHLASCEECRDILAFLRRVDGERPEARASALEAARTAAAREFAERTRFTGPERMEEGIVPLNAARERPRWLSDLRWSLPAAAVLVVALGTSAIWFGGGGPQAGGIDPLEAVQSEVDGYAFYLGEDPVIAGGVVLEQLSDDELQTLLEELES
jgi:predicted anti-sigma-YlaC factor YlaD